MSRSVLRSIFLVMVLVAAGCSLPALNPTLPSPDLTLAYETLDAALTAAAATTIPTSSLTTATLTPNPSPFYSPSPSSTATAEATPLATDSPAVPCNRAAPGTPTIDITIPDDTTLQPGQVFSKTWRLRNVGNCTWTRDYSVVWFSGDPLSAPRSIHLPEEVKPGGSVDITLDMVAPQRAGTYYSNWKLSDAQGNLFGIGPTGGSPFWAKILVLPTNTSTPQPSPTPTSTPEVRVTGLANLTPGDTLDLDSNQLRQGEDDDLAYNLSADNKHMLVPIHGASLGVFGFNLPDYQACLDASLVNESLVINGMAVGTYFCYHTGQGLPGWARLVFLNYQDKALTLEILTWVAP